MKHNKMKHSKKAMSIVALALALTIMFPSIARAASYRDIPPSHYAYTAVDWVSNPAYGSLMVGDANNNFNPDKTMDKFEAAKIIAVAAGLKYSNITPQEQEIYDRAYSEYKSYLDQMASQYAKWNKTADREIAYLMYKNVLTSLDVSRFITKATSTEIVNVLSKQEAIVLMLRADGKQSNVEAITIPYHTPYKDDALITADYKKYIYYAKEIGIAGGSEGYISPTRAITRAEMAQMLYNMLGKRPQATAVPTTAPTAAPTPTPTATPAPTAVPTATVNGTIELVYQNTHVTITASNVPKIYKIAANAVIAVDNEQKTAEDLKIGMTVTAMINNNEEIVSMVARSPQTATPTPTPTPEATPMNLAEDEGYVSAVSTTSGNMVTVKTQRVKLTGEIVTDEKTYTPSSNCVITRGDVSVNFSDIKVNDIISFKYSGSVMYEANLQEKDRTIRGTLLEKKFVDATGSPVLVIEDAKKVKYELRVTSTTSITRGSVRNQLWTDLRVGDDIEAQCEYDKIISLYASGVRSTVNGTLEEIHITQDVQQIVLRKSDRTFATYTLTPGTSDVYALRIGMEVRLYLDSWEVYEISVLSSPSTATTSVVGYIQSIRSGNTIIVMDSYYENANTYNIKIDDETIDTATMKQLDFNKLRVNMNVYVVFSSTNTNVAKSITILP